MWFHMIPLVDDEDKKGVCNRGGGYIWLHPPATPAHTGWPLGNGQWGFNVGNHKAHAGLSTGLDLRFHKCANV